jgi:hypothetical protein
METISEIKDEIKKLCRCCKLEKLDFEFEAKRRQCKTCMNKKRYEANKKNNYYNNYYDQHKDIVLKCQHEYYLRKKEKLKNNNTEVSENEN